MSPEPSPSVSLGGSSVSGGIFLLYVYSPGLHGVAAQRGSVTLLADSLGQSVLLGGPALQGAGSQISRRPEQVRSPKQVLWR